jgi:AraC-like DNA-binding protein
MFWTSLDFNLPTGAASSFAQNGTCCRKSPADDEGKCRISFSDFCGEMPLAGSGHADASHSKRLQGARARSIPAPLPTMAVSRSTMSTRACACELNSSAAAASALTRGVRSYIEQSLGHDLSIGKLAKVAGLSPQYFAEMFRQTTGFTPHQYVSHRRVERARQLLVDTDLPLAEVAHRCGFSSQSQFTTVFQRLTEVTPGKFRAEQAPPDKASLAGLARAAGLPRQ